MAFPVPSIVSSGKNWAFFQSAGLTGLLEAVIAAQAATADPTSAPTLAANTDAASTLPSATYYVKITETNAFGETRPSPLSSGQAVTSGTNHLTVTFPTLKTGNTARNVYVGKASDGSDLKLAASGITAASLNIAAALPTNSYAVAPPTVNSTAPTSTGADGVVRNKALELIRAFERGNAEDAYRYAAQVFTGFLAGNPVAWNDQIAKVRHAYAAFLVVAQTLNEAAVLMDANAGTLATTSTPIGGRKSVRTWP